MYADNVYYQDCKVLTFTNGSFIVNYATIFKKKSPENVKTVEDTVSAEIAKQPGGAFRDMVVDILSLVVRGKFVL